MKKMVNYDKAVQIYLNKAEQKIEKNYGYLNNRQKILLYSIKNSLNYSQTIEDKKNTIKNLKDFTN